MLDTSMQKVHNVYMKTVVELHSFIKTSASVFVQAEVKELIDYLSVHSKAGDVIPGGAGLRKLRWERAGMGKRGGARVIYYYATEKEEVYLLLAYAKNRQENLTKEQLKKLVQLME